jgi:hypothetical protein
MRRAGFSVAVLLGLAVPATVPAPAGAAALAAPSGAASQVMVVGKERVLRAPVSVTLRARNVSVGARRCAAGKATPLSLLAGTRLRLRLRDYGSCGRSPRDAGGLFVTRVGAESNRGNDGWVYKVGRRSGTAGAADPGGSFGNGRRLRGRDRVLWFWCVQDLQQHCQRTLEAVPEQSVVARGASLRVRVRAYDDFGRAVPAAGAIVRMNATEAVAGPDGVATLIAPARSGGASLVATGAGAVRSFSERVTIR